MELGFVQTWLIFLLQKEKDGGKKLIWIKTFNVIHIYIFLFKGSTAHVSLTANHCNLLEASKAYQRKHCSTKNKLRDKIEKFGKAKTNPVNQANLSSISVLKLVSYWYKTWIFKGMASGSWTLYYNFQGTFLSSSL